MQLGSFSIGFWKYPNGRIAWDSPLFEYNKCYEGCHILTLWILDVSWLNGKCVDGD